MMVATTPESSERQWAIKEELLPLTAGRDGETETAQRHDAATPRKCRDVVCTLVFLAALAGAGCVMGYAFEHGDYKKLVRGIDWNGRVCGLSPETKDADYLYWCPHPASHDVFAPHIVNIDMGGVWDRSIVWAASGRLDLGHPICVSSCPTDTNAHSQCYQGSSTKQTEADGSGTFSVKTTYEFSLVHNYKTTSVLHGYCMPREPVLLNQIRPQLTSDSAGVLVKVAQVQAAWRTLIYAAGFALVVGYVFLLSSRILAAPAVWLSLFSATVLPIIAGICLISLAYSEFLHERWEAELERLGNSTMTATLQQKADEFADHLVVANPPVSILGNKTLDVILGVVCCLVGVVVAVATCMLQSRIERVLGCLEATFECIMQMPMLIVYPVLFTLTKIPYLFMCTSMLGMFLTVGEVSNISVPGIGSSSPAGIVRKFSLSDNEKVYFAFLVFMAAWVFELLLAIDHYAFAHAVRKWYFSEYTGKVKVVSPFAFVKGAFDGVVFHMGGLAMASLLLVLFRTLEAIIFFVKRQVVAASADSNQAASGAAKVACTSCGCFLRFLETLVRYSNKGTYVVMDQEGLGFFDAADRAIVISQELVESVGIAFSTKAFQAGTLLSVTGTGGFGAYVLVTKVAMYSDPTSDQYVASPEYVAAAAALVSFVVATSFTFIFDHVSETLLFCYTMDPDKKGSHVPSTLRHLAR